MTALREGEHHPFLLRKVDRVLGKEWRHEVPKSQAFNHLCEPRHVLKYLWSFAKVRSKGICGYLCIDIYYSCLTKI